MSKQRGKMTARIPVSTEVQKMYKDIVSGASVTYDELLQFLGEEIGAELNQPEANLGAGFRMRERLKKWVAEKDKQN